MMKKFNVLTFVLCTFLFTITNGFAQNVPTSDVELNQVVGLKDEPLSEYQNKLLDLAFESATMIPVYPHIKDRSRMQEMVVATLLKLDQPHKALNLIEKIEDWRQGSAYADLAFYCVQHNFNDGAKKYIDLAKQIADKGEDWRKDTIKVKIAKAYMLMGQTDQAEQFEENIVDSESGKLLAAKVMSADQGSFDEQMKEIDELLGTENFEITKNALYSSTELFHKFYDDKKKRTQVENKIKTSWKKMPLFVRIELLNTLGKMALVHGDSKKSLKLINEAQEIFDGAEWPLEYRISMAAQLIDVRFKSGDKEKAKADADALRALFEIDGNKIVDIYRAGSIRPLAEAYQSMGDSASALAIYKKAIEEGIQNPNSRPRAEDLTATLISMVSNQVEPDDAFLQEISQIKEGLGDPW